MLWLPTFHGLIPPLIELIGCTQAYHPFVFYLAPCASWSSHRRILPPTVLCPGFAHFLQLLRFPKLSCTHHHWFCGLRFSSMVAVYQGAFTLRSSRLKIFFHVLSLLASYICFLWCRQPAPACSTPFCFRCSGLEINRFHTITFPFKLPANSGSAKVQWISLLHDPSCLTNLDTGLVCRRSLGFWILESMKMAPSQFCKWHPLFLNHYRWPMLNH